MSKFSGLRKIPEVPAVESVTAPESEPPKKIGRPRAKRSNPEFTQVTAYIRQDTHNEAKKRLIDEKREFSELLQELVSTWLQKK